MLFTSLLKRSSRVALLSSAMALVLSCSVVPSTTSTSLLNHRAAVDFTGLRPARMIDTIKASVTSPVGWDRLVTQRAALYTHEQWRSPSMQTGVGCAYIRMPLPFSADTICWLARQEYAKQSKHGDGGKITSNWTDNLGRVWFEGENKRYHVRGYVVTHGFEAWIVYFGYRVPSTPDPGELSVAMRSLEAIVPSLPQSAPQIARK